MPASLVDCLAEFKWIWLIGINQNSIEIKLQQTNQLIETAGIGSLVLVQL